jgi:hypothetical protein
MGVFSLTAYEAWKMFYYIILETFNFSMFESRPELLEIFSKFKGRDLMELKRAGLLRQHALRVMATIDKVITRLDEPTALITLLKEAGAHHKLYKVPQNYLKVYVAYQLVYLVHVKRQTFI